MPKCRVFIGTQCVVIIDDEYYLVECYTKHTKLKKNKAYMKDDFVYVYRGKIKDRSDANKPGIYKLGGEIIFIEPTGKDKDKYDIDNVNELSLSSIFDAISEDITKFVQPSDIEIINNNSETFTPTLRPEDDFLKHIVKQAILLKRINLKNYRDRFSNEYALNNMKSGLSKSTKMTVPNFIKWCEILGLDWEMTIRDNGEDTINPLPEEIYMSSHMT